MAESELQLTEPVTRFADCNSDFRSSRYVVFGVPFDATVSHRSGASRAPAAIREETYNFETYLMDLDVDLVEIPMADIGDIVVVNDEAHQEKMIEDTRNLISLLMEEGKFPLMMGGEHSVTEGAADAFMELHHNKGGTIVIVDAHLDLRNEYQGNPHSHACVSRRIVEKWGSDRVVMVGIRSGSREEVLEADRMNINYVTAEQVRQVGIHGIVEAWDGALSLKDRPVYLSVDIDGMDPAYAPGTGTPEPWGLTSMDVLHLLQELRNNVVAMDVVEVSPEVEAFLTPGLAGRLMRQMIGLKEMVIRNPTWLEKI